MRRGVENPVLCGHHAGAIRRALLIYIIAHSD